MKIEIGERESANDAAQRYYAAAKEARVKKEALTRSVTYNTRRLEIVKEQAAKEAIEQASKKAELSAGIVVKKVERRERAWHDKYHSFTTSGGFLVISGKDAKQNERIVADHLEKDDIFFHADIQGAAATILKTNHAEYEAFKKDHEQDLKEAAQWAASFSSAWKKGLGVVDVYCTAGHQISKYSTGEYVAKGAFMVYGKREWFRHTPLELAPLKATVGENGKVEREERLVPALHLKADPVMTIRPGEGKRESIAKMVGQKINASTAEIERFIPGPAAIIQLK